MKRLLRRIATMFNLSTAFSSTEYSDAMSEDMQRDAERLRRSALRAATVPARTMASNAKLRASLARSDVRAFADLENLFHSQDQRNAHGG